MSTSTSAWSTWYVGVASEVTSAPASVARSYAGSVTGGTWAARPERCLHGGWDGDARAAGVDDSTMGDVQRLGIRLEQLGSDGADLLAERGGCGVDGVRERNIIRSSWGAAPS